MDQLKLLSSLENHYNFLSDYEDKKKHLYNTFLKDEKDNVLIELEKNINRLKIKNQNAKENLKQAEKSLKEHDFTIKEIESRLYSGNIKDLKQLELLSHEKNQIKTTIDNTESDLLNHMEEIEINEDKLIALDIQLKNIVQKNNEKKLKYIEIDKELNMKINKEKIEIEKIEINMDKNLLDKYKDIRNNNKTGLGLMEDGICTACNMKVSTSLAERVKDSVNIIYCENCGRILYYSKL